VEREGQGPRRSSPRERLDVEAAGGQSLVAARIERPHVAARIERPHVAARARS
jgi:hypothetical protein